ncbi:MAG: 30S ribosomal protein S12 methylthiotransferase RimO [Bacteroidia bacterium]|nr:30S ribosomal protein S12 methylthiotransferase RimO [Bacteroidia bacterium]
MKARTLKKNKVNVITLGCSKNVVDSEVLMGQLKANAIEVGHETGESDHRIVIINTCGFIDNAKQESIDMILQYASERRAGNIDQLLVTGCLSERYREDLKKEIPDVDDWFGTRELPRLLKTLKADYRQELLGERLLTTPSHYAYFKISEGCDRPCSFCAIPLMRGRHVSVPMDELVRRAAVLTARGTTELLLIAQDSTYYGLDIYGERKLAELMQRLSEVNGIRWIRLHYAFPGGFPEDVIEVIAKNEKVCKYIDIPLQHISNPLLQNMKRGVTRDKTNDLIRKLRENVPGISIRTTLISGFPGETLEMHLELRDWVREMRFDRLGVFTYSHEENTGAFQLKDDVPAKEKTRRAAEIMEVQRGISLSLNEQKVGKVLEVLVDRFEDGNFIGRTEHDSPEVDNEVIIAAGGQHLRLGDFIKVRISSAGEYDLFADFIG